MKAFVEDITPGKAMTPFALIGLIHSMGSIRSALCRYQARDANA